MITEGVKIGGIRRIIADRMSESLRTAAQLTYHTTLNAAAMVSGRNRWKVAGQPVGYEDIVLGALVDAIGKFPKFNAIVNGDVIYQSAAVDACVAIDLPSGLVAPAIWDISTMTVPEISAARRAVVDRAKSGKLTVREMTGGSITVSNLGGTSVEHFTPILNGGQLAILGIGRIAVRPWVTGSGTIEALPVMGLSLTVDHRIIDGAESGAFLSYIAAHLEAIDASSAAQVHAE